MQPIAAEVEEHHAKALQSARQQQFETQFFLVCYRMATIATNIQSISLEKEFEKMIASAMMRHLTPKQSVPQRDAAGLIPLNTL